MLNRALTSASRLNRVIHVDDRVTLAERRHCGPREGHEVNMGRSVLFETRIPFPLQGPAATIERLSRRAKAREPGLLKKTSLLTINDSHPRDRRAPRGRPSSEG